MLIFGVVLAVVSFVVVLAFGTSNQPPPAADDPDVSVVVAAQKLMLGTAITPEMLGTTTRPESEAENTYRYPEDVVGLVIRRSVAQGAALTSDDFQTSTTVPDLVASIQPGLRAMAVPLNKVDSVGMLLQAGDFVDVVMTIADTDLLNPVVTPNELPTGVGGDSPVPYVLLDDYMNNTTVKVVVQNVQVLAALPRVVGDDQNAANGDPAMLQPDLVAVLAVQPQQVEVIRFAQLDGHISLVLRTPSDYAQGSVTTTGITLWELVNRWGVLPPQPIVQP
jgi:Flp pilus assembly protein CpaB